MESKLVLDVCACEKSILNMKESISLFSEDAYTLIYIAQGKGKMIANKVSVPIQTNTVICLKPQREAKILASYEEMRLIYLQYSGGESDYLYRLSAFNRSGPACITRNKELFWNFESIYTEFVQKEVNRYYLVAEIFHIFSHFTEHITIKESFKYHNRYLKRAIDVIQENPSMPISVNVLAERVNIDRSYLYRIFKKETALSPREYMIDYKLKLSVEKVGNKKENIQSIFEKLGFSSYYLAEKKFKEKYGMTPREYQRQEGFEGKSGTLKNH